ncbi:MAG: CBS domain-containing protein [Steroidobacterales bacterium]
MNNSPLILNRMQGEGSLPRRAVTDGQYLQLGDPAIYAVTDFTREYPITVGEDRQIDMALDDMIRFGVRALLVVRDQRTVGLITSYDIQGERPLQFLQTSNYNRHQDVRVGDIMTPWAQLLSLDWHRIETASAGELLLAIQQAGLTHLIVVENGEGRSLVVRGLVSMTRLERQLRRIAASDGGWAADAAGKYLAAPSPQPDNPLRG